MQVQYIKKITNLVYVWLFLPVFENLSEAIIHEIEHKLFFNKDLLKLTGRSHLFSNHLIEANGDAFYSGLRLQFFLMPELLENLLSTLENIFKQDLPEWTKEEAIRFKKELKEDDSFMKLSLDYKAKCLGLTKQKKKILVSKIWKTKFDLKNARVLVVGDVKENKKYKSWEKILYKKINTTFSEKKSLDWYDDIEEYNYNIFFAVNTDIDNYVCMKIMQNILYEELTKQYVQTGRSYGVNLKNKFEQDFMVVAFDILTSDKAVKKPVFKTKISKIYFEKMLKRTFFEELSDEDVQVYGCFPVIAFMPQDIKMAFKKITYSKFLKFYKQKLQEISIYWL